MRNTILFSVVAAAVLMAAVSWVGAQPAPQFSKDALQVAQNNNQFALDLYGQLRDEQGNLFFSPYSISSALAMTYGGAKGTTADEMAKTLHFTLPGGRLHPAFGELVHGLNAREAKRPYQLSVANALWGQKGFTFLPDFLKLTQDQYEAGLKEVDFANNAEDARQTINAWVEKQTQDKIKNLLQKGVLSSDTRLVLTNAIYFKAPWEREFAEAATKEADFTLTGSAKVKTPMMHKNEKLRYMEDGNLQMVNIPYKQGGLSMIVLLPKKADGLPELEKSLTADNLDRWLKQMTQYQVDLKLPRFKVTSQFQLADKLARMGMKAPFLNGADFSGMTTQEKLKIDKVIHKAFVDVNEKGTEAAAATAVIMVKTSAIFPLPKRVNFHANHPFIYLIRENQTGSILFVGRLANPKS